MSYARGSLAEPVGASDGSAQASADHQGGGRAVARADLKTDEACRELICLTRKIFAAARVLRLTRGVSLNRGASKETCGPEFPHFSGPLF